MALTVIRDVVSSTISLLLLDSDPSVTGTTNPNPDPGSVLLVRTDVPGIYYKSGPLPTNWTLLGSSSPIVPVYAKMSGILLDQNVVSGGSVNLAFDVADYESAVGSGVVPIINLAAERFETPVAGIYLISCIASWNEKNLASGLLSTRILINGVATDPPVAESPVVTPWVNASNIVVSAFQLGAGARITFQILQDTGSDQTVKASEATIQRIG